MAARLFLVKWTYDPNTRTVTNALESYLANNDVGDPDIRIWWFHADPDPAVNYTPKHPWVICLVIAPNLTGAQVEQAGNLSGVTLIPPIRPSYPLTDIPLAKRTAISTFLTNNGFDLSSLNSSSTMLDLIKVVAGTIKPLVRFKELEAFAVANESDFD